MYSNNPPKTAPRMLEPNAFGIIFTFLKDVAKITPAKNIGAETRDMPKILSKKEIAGQKNIIREPITVAF